MDPYLEEPGLWPDVHNELISGIRTSLGSMLRPKYYVRIEERVYISDESDPGRSVLIPDVRIADRTEGGATSFEPSGVATLEVAEPIVATTLIEDEIHEPRVEVIDREQRLVVTVIEVLSPTNKVPGSRGRASYERKRQEVMHSPSHFVEIDLLRAGEPLRAREVLPPCDYTVHVSRNGQRPQGLIWPIRLEQRLPVITIPLRPEDPDAKLDLQAVLNAAYDRAGYDLMIDYHSAPVPALSPPQAAWAEALLRSRGLR
jgi:hypothetical protein